MPQQVAKPPRRWPDLEAVMTVAFIVAVLGIVMMCVVYVCQLQHH